MPGQDYDPATGSGTNYLRPFLKDVKRAAGAVGRAVTGKKSGGNGGTQLMGDTGKSNERAHGKYEHNSPAKPL